MVWNLVPYDFNLHWNILRPLYVSLCLIPIIFLVAKDLQHGNKLIAIIILVTSVQEGLFFVAIEMSTIVYFRTLILFNLLLIQTSSIFWSKRKFFFLRLLFNSLIVELFHFLMIDELWRSLIIGGILGWIFHRWRGALALDEDFVLHRLGKEGAFI